MVFFFVDLSSCPCCAVRCPAWALKASFGRRASFGAPSSEGEGTRVQRSFVHFIAPMGVRRTLSARARTPCAACARPHCIALLAPNHNLSTQACCEWAPGWVERWGGEFGVSLGHLHQFFFSFFPVLGGSVVVARPRMCRGKQTHWSLCAAPSSTCPVGGALGVGAYIDCL